MSTQLAHLRKFIVQYYSLDDFYTLCFDLGINYDDLAGERISSKARELLLRTGEHHQFVDLVTELSRAREKAFIEAGFSTEQAFIDMLEGEYPRYRHEEAAAKRTDRFEQTLLNEVRRKLIEQKLESGLTGSQIINPGKEYWPDEVLDPWAEFIGDPKAAQAIDDELTMIDVFLASEGSLLILGEKGSGKTTMQLLLARWLVEKADDPSEPLPLFLFLKSWEKGVTIYDWLVAEINHKYGTPKEIVRDWLDDWENGRLVFLLDGLDKVEENQAECVAALNEFIQKYQFKITVTSRVKDYQELRPEKLRLKNAVYLKPFTTAQVETYWDLVGEKATEIRHQIKENKLLQKFTSQPFWLSYMTQLSGSLPVEERELYMERTLLRLNVEDKLAEREGNDKYPPEQARRFLAWLGYQMVQHSREEVFFMEKMQPTWLPSNFSRKIHELLVNVPVVILIALLVYGLGAEALEPQYRIINPAMKEVYQQTAMPLLSVLVSLLILLIIRGRFSRSITAIFGIVGGLTAAFLVASVTRTNILEIMLTPGRFTFLLNDTDWSFTIFTFLFSIPVFALLFWLIGRGKVAFQENETIKPAEIVQWSWHRALYGFFVGVLVGAVLGMLMQFGTQFSWLAYDSYSPCDSSLLDQILCETSAFVLFSQVSWLAAGLLFAVILGFSGHERTSGKNLKPNEGIWQSGTNALRIGLLAVLALGIPFGLSASLNWGIYTGLLGGVIATLLLGGFAFLQHFALRAILVVNGVMPWGYTRFLDSVVACGLMSPMFGGYNFDHQELKEYFCWLEENDYS